MTQNNKQKPSDDKTTKNDFLKGIKQGFAFWLIRELLEAFFS
ncbi:MULTISPECIES: hypothetical protein [unclassified Pseudoalteromonas]|nr:MULTISPECIES: hypothetical protein [unclassified Pseudoalteromonas]